jgi:hypothetical protein
MLKITPQLEEHIEDYLSKRLWYLDILRRVKDKVEDEIAAIKDAQPYEYQIHRRDAIRLQRDYWFDKHKKLVVEAAETKSQMAYIEELINRRAKELGLDQIELWQNISSKF